MSDEILRAIQQGSISSLVDRLIKDEMDGRDAFDPRSRPGVTPEVVALAKRVVTRTVERLAAERQTELGRAAHLVSRTT